MQRFLVGNWKMNLGPRDARRLLAVLRKAAEELRKTAVWVAPPALSLPAAAEVLQGSAILYGAQNAHWEQKGAFTGEISLPMLAELGASFCLAGHSERRHIFLESTEMCARRAAAILSAQMTCIFCVGETLAERESGTTLRVIESQLSPLLSLNVQGSVKNLILAYEPVWAIGTGKVASLDQISETHQSILDLWKLRTGASICPPLLYGGSVSPDNYREIASLPVVQGALVGGASIDADKFSALIRISEER